MSKSNYCSFILAVAAAVCTPAQAQSSYPTKAVRLVVGFTAGGPTDLPARAVADKLGALLGERVVVENKPGAGGQLATQDVLSKPADGYSLLLCTHFESINQALYKNLSWKLGDIAPISQISRYYYGVAASNELPAKDWKSFIEYARANPGKVNYGSVGRGSAQEILALELGKLTGIQLTGVSYKGATQVVPDLLAGRIHLFVSPTLSVLPHHQAGKLRILAVSSPERLPAAPDVPTVKEQGVDFVRFGWLGICAPAGTPQPIIATLNRHISNVVKTDRDYRQLIEKAGSIPLSSTPEELAKILRETYEQTAATVREFGLQRD